LSSGLNHEYMGSTGGASGGPCGELREKSQNTKQPQHAAIVALARVDNPAVHTTRVWTAGYAGSWVDHTRPCALRMDNPAPASGRGLPTLRLPAKLKKNPRKPALRAWGLRHT